MKSIALLMLLTCMVMPLFAQVDDPSGNESSDTAEEQPIQKRVYTTVKVNGDAPAVDGSLRDPAWNKVEWSGDFIQRDPTDGEPPSQQTKFKVLYSEDAVYFGFRAYDDPERVTSMLARRDWFPGDWVEVNIDSYNDRRTAFSFTLSVSGTRGDEFISNDGNNWDGNWDPVWHGAAQVDDEGWTAEMKIPLSQLRFSSEEVQTWGLQVQRRIFREEERSTWQRIPKDSSGWVSKFGELRGIRDVRPGRRVELLPYTVAKAERFEKVDGDPFRDGSSSDFNGGVDGKIGLTSDLTLDFTINPDFGQVEADPSEVNLTAFETYFQERRPFFIEGNNILKLQLAPAITGGHFTRDTMFYSRRIGRRPSHWPDLADDECLDQPDNTSILGAFKLSGKTASGLSIGILESVTARERGEIDLDGSRRHETVEPLSNYFVGRLQQDFRDGDTYLGAMVTSVHRNNNEEHLQCIRRQAYASGIDFNHYFKGRDYRIEARLMGSNLRGSPEAIDDAQTSSARYFQRPDNDHVSYDPGRRSLYGHAGSWMLTRTGNNTRFRFQTGMAYRSPGFEINDLGYMRNADEINQFTWAGYTIRNPFSIFRRWSFNTNQWLDWDFGGNFLGASYNINSHATFKNNWNLGWGITRSDEHLSNTMLRGGPASRWPGDWSYNLNCSTDSRRDLRIGCGGYTSRADENSQVYENVWVDLTYRPSNALRLGLYPSHTWNRKEMQYVDTQSFGDEDRYLFGHLNQKTFALTFRLDYCITPDLTIQYYGAPFVSAGRYSNFKRITDPKAGAYRDRFAEYDGGEIAYNDADEVYDIDENRDGEIDYSLDDPDFNFRDWNSNLVVRWEYRPGSLLYVVWSQARSMYLPGVGDFDIGTDINELFDVHPHNVLLVKFSKWFSM